MRSYAASGGPGTYPHPHELHPGYDPMDPSDFERTYQQRPVDLGYNRSYSPNPVAAIAASASVSEGWTHPLAVTNSDWIDSRVGQHAGIPWPPHRYLRFYERSEQCFSLNFSAKMQNCKKKALKITNLKPKSKVVIELFWTFWQVFFLLAFEFECENPNTHFCKSLTNNVNKIKTF